MSQTFSEKFVHYLQSVRVERGKMATLRKGLIETQAQATWPLLSRFVDFNNHYQIKVIQTVAGLFAHHSQVTDTGNMGSVCYRLMDDKEKKDIAKGESGPISRNFQYALAANKDEVFPRIRRLIFRAKNCDVPVNYIQLTNDLWDWNSYKKEKVKLAWGREFWKVELDEKNKELPQENSNND